MVKRKIVFLLACFTICIAPFAAMVFTGSSETTEKRSLAEWPKWHDDTGELNYEYLQLAGDYFNDHFAFRNELIAADAQLMGKAFRTSLTDTVLVGKKDWLYYTSSLDDYLGRDVLSPRGAFQIANNLKIVQNKMEQENILFGITIAPNKNSLYDENMPYYYAVKESQVKNYSLVGEQLKKQGVNYIDLYDPFTKEGEVLYRNQDSHWNQKGAVLAYDTILNFFSKRHTDYSKIQISRTKTNIGDLANALYSVSAKPEWDYQYDSDMEFTYSTETDSWEDFWIQTQAEGKTGHLLMYRDSFGNTLAPLLAEEYASGAFSKDSIYHLDDAILRSQPDTVLFEIVERNLRHYGEYSTSNFSSGPPIMENPIIKRTMRDADAAMTSTTIEASICEQQTSMIQINGELDDAYVDTTTRVLVEVKTENINRIYEAYTYTDCDAGSENGYLIYLNQTSLPSNHFIVRVYTEGEDGSCTMVLSKNININL